MLKRMDGAYEPSKRSDLWVKLKKDYIKGLQDTLDLVPIGAWFGNGRKVSGCCGVPCGCDCVCLDGWAAGLGRKGREVGGGRGDKMVVVGGSEGAGMHRREERHSCFVSQACR